METPNAIFLLFELGNLKTFIFVAETFNLIQNEECSEESEKSLINMMFNSSLFNKYLIPFTYNISYMEILFWTK